MATISHPFLFCWDSVDQLFNLLIDLLYSYLDPRVRYE